MASKAGGRKSTRATIKPHKGTRKTPKKTARPSAPKRRPQEPNLLISIDEPNRGRAVKEVGDLLRRIGVSQFALLDGPGPGLLGVFVAEEDPKACIARARGLLMEDPFAFVHTHRWIPIEAWTGATAKDLASFAEHANASIAPMESWRIQVERHGSEADREMLVTKMADKIGNPNVDLDNADKTILMEVVGDRAGLAIVGSSDTLSVDQTMKKEFVRFEEVK